MVVVLVDEITNRVRYTFDFIFEIRGLEYTLVSDSDEFLNFEGVKLNYSSHLIEGVTFIKPSVLLYDNSIWNGNLESINKATTEFLSFDGVEDPVASIFYVLSRMEEYNCKNYDEHGRFPFTESILSRFKWIEKAMCDRWAEYIVKYILHLDVVVSQGLFIPTFDIDNTYAYKLKSGKRKVLSIIRDYIKLDTKRLKERLVVKYGGVDPYDTFEKIKEVSKKFSSTKVFWLTESNGAKDRNISIENAEHRKLIKEVAQLAEVNIHPSYASFLNADQISLEKDNLAAITEKSITSSRQHYLRFQLPNSFRDLISAGITDDYSMGFAEHLGFRSGTARAHNWFDLENNESTGLTIHPFVYMDGTLREYMKIRQEESKLKIKNIYDEVQLFGGDFIFLWHNETIGDYENWDNWSQVLEFTLNLKNE